MRHDRPEPLHYETKEQRCALGHTSGAQCLQIRVSLEAQLHGFSSLHLHSQAEVVSSNLGRGKGYRVCDIYKQTPQQYGH
jgi:hypothetical protein